MSEAILRASGISKFFGGLTAVNQVDFEVYPGEVVALLGDNGAGKSTLIKCISGVYRPEQGNCASKTSPSSSSATPSPMSWLWRIGWWSCGADVLLPICPAPMQPKN